MKYFVFLVYFNLKAIESLNIAPSQDQSLLEINESWQEYGYCIDPSKGQSPLQIVPPFSHIELQLRFQLLPQEGVFIKNTGHELIAMGQFGFVTHNGKQFNAYQIKFKTPSEHSLGSLNLFFPLEMQIFFISHDQFRLGISVLFQLDKGNRNNPFLSKIGFGRNIIKDLQSGESFQMPDLMHLSDLIDERTNFLVYQGSDTYPPCEQMVWFVSFDLQFINQNQATDFPQNLVYLVRETQVQKRPVFCNFDPVLFAMIEGKQIETQAASRNVPFISSDHRVQYSEEKTFKDCFTILGDTTVFDLYIYTKGMYAGKVIRNDDYFVVKVKEVPPKLEEPKESVETDEEKIKRLSENKDKGKAKDNKKDKKKKNEIPPEPEPEVVPEEIPEEDEIEAPQTLQDRIKQQQIHRAQEDQSRQNTIPEDQDLGVQDIDQEYFNTDQWPTLCIYGKQQSPILLKSDELIKSKLEIPVTNYTYIPKEIFLQTDGWKLKLIGDQMGFGTLQWMDKIYLATEVHFHHPSEHALGDNEFRMDMEVQIIHRSKDSEILVLVIFLHHTYETEKNNFLESIGITTNKKIKYRQLKQGELITLANREIKLSTLFNGNVDSFITYTGSLSTPPCVENVHYIVKRNREPISETQINNFISLQGRQSNIRALQNLNHRTIYQN